MDGGDGSTAVMQQQQQQESAASPGDDSEEFVKILNIIENRWESITPKFFGASASGFLRVVIEQSRLILLPVHGGSMSLVGDEDKAVVVESQPQQSCISLQRNLAQICLLTNGGLMQEALRRMVWNEPILQAYMYEDSGKWSETKPDGACGDYFIASMVLNRILSSIHSSGEENIVYDTHLQLDNLKTQEYLELLFNCILEYLPVEDSSDYISKIRSNITNFLLFLHTRNAKFKKEYWMNEQTLQGIIASINAMLRLLKIAPINLVFLRNHCHGDWEKFYQIQQTTHSVDFRANRMAVRSGGHWQQSCAFPTSIGCLDSCHYFQSSHEHRQNCVEGRLDFEFPCTDLVANILHELQGCLLNNKDCQRIVEDPVDVKKPRLSTVTDEQLDYANDLLRNVLSRHRRDRGDHIIPRPMKNMVGETVSVCWFISTINALANCAEVRGIVA